MNRDVVRQITNIVAVIATIIVNVLSNVLPFNDLTTGEISDRFQVVFVPAGYVFSIWGVIYLGMIAFAVYQALPAQRENPRLRRVGYLFALSGLANMAWLFLWHYEQFTWTLVAMFTLLALLILIYLRLEIGQNRVPAAETLMIRVPISIYLGWITVATIANVTQVLYYWGWSGWGISGEVWAVILLAVATALSAAMIFTRDDIAYLLVITWSVIGVAVKQADSPLVATAAWIAAGAIVLLLVAGTLARRRTSLKPA